MSTTKKNIQFAVFTCLILALGIYIGSRSSDLQISSGLGLTPSRKVNKILHIIQKKYVDKVAVDSLEDLAINEILAHLDPHSVYLPPIQAKTQNESLEGNFDGIGVEYYLINDTLFVTHVREDGPSFKAGLIKGDKIIAVNGQKLGGTALLSESMVNKLRGKKGSEVNVSVLRKGLAKPKQFTIIRDRIFVSSIDAAFLMKAGIGFIKITNFGSNTDEDFVNELGKLQDKGMQSLILDLRGNGGGYLNSATALADQFLPDGKLIVYTKGLHEPRTDYFATEDGVFEKGKLIILIDEGTASASEIVAGALQDLDRGTIIGRRSFGKGLVQEQFGFGDGSAMNLTIARYYTPSGRSIQKSYRNGTLAYKNEINQRYERGEYTSLDSALKDSMFNSTTQTYKTSKGKVVYGGGGIMPDVFIALDTTNITSFYRAISSKNLIPEYVYGTLVNNFNPKKYLTADEFVNKYIFNETDFKQFLAFCKARKITLNGKEMLLSKPLITKQIKALLARFYFNEEGFYKVYNQDDNFVIKAIEKIKNPA
jgi:carboxyl-terminal processing protease